MRPEGALAASRAPRGVIRVALLRIPGVAAAAPRASVAPEIRRLLTPMPDSVLAAIIAGTATLSASFLQLRSAALRDAGRGQSGPAARRKNRFQRLVLLIIIGAAALSGFALSQWLSDGERARSGALQRDLQARIEELSRTANELTGARVEIENTVLRRLGVDGVAVTATVPACRPSRAGSSAVVAAAAPVALSDTGPPAPAARPCAENDASPVTLCASIPAAAKITEVDLFSRLADADTPWSASRLAPGVESAQARFAEKYSEGTPESGMRPVCQAFANWSAEHARAVRVLVRYSL
jgi:hypothetical protein